MFLRSVIPHGSKPNSIEHFLGLETSDEYEKHENKDFNVRFISS